LTPDETEFLLDLLHLIKNKFDRKRIYSSSYPNPNSNANLTLTPLDSWSCLTTA